MAGFADFISYLDSFGILGGGVIFFWALYTERLRFGRDFNDMEDELKACRGEIKAGQDEIKMLWAQKVEDKEKAADLAQAYLKIREVEKP